MRPACPLFPSCFGLQCIAAGMRVVLVVALLGLALPAYSQSRTDSISSDSAQRLRHREQNKLSNNLQDTTRRNTQFYSGLKSKSKKNKYLSKLYSVIFREPKNPVLEKSKKDKSVQILQKQLAEHNGKTIRNIRIKTLGVFGPKVFDTLAMPRNFLERAGNAAHFTTQRVVVANQLLFSRGDIFNSLEIANNERILRQNNYLVDARIYPIPTQSSDSIDLLVVTQDVFSIGIGFGVGSYNAFSFQLADRNLLGMNHELKLGYNFDYARPQRHEYTATYYVPYIYRNTFISARADYINTQDRDIIAGEIFRDFLFNNTKWAGKARFERAVVNTRLFRLDTSYLIPVGGFTYDAWLGRSFSVPGLQTYVSDKLRLVLSGRVLNQVFFRRPLTSGDSNQIFRNRTNVLISFGYSNRDFFRDALINGYGRTEDIPYGSSLVFTAGAEDGQLGLRRYGGLRFSKAKYINKLGYVRVLAEAGSYLNFTTPQQGTTRAELFYYSPLTDSPTLRLRQFITLRYTHGYNRFENEFLNINNNSGIQGVSADTLRGVRSLVASFETVAFINFDVLSFKIAPFFHADLGWVSRGANVFDKPPFVGLGLGVRLFNERLTISNFQMRLNYYPNIPGISPPFRSNFGTRSPLRLTDFSINQPEIIGL